ncbi:MAG: hemerythrin domain-containing protein [Motiliproteus sp.]|nr:hemerythrin domain-containing protein [Motiliproteus sp.]MCW9053440.1 hemerythrin domain-containing protein [Motiliproteus sp.]
MTSIAEYMTTQHRCCDDSFVAAESAVSDKNWDEARSQWQTFCNDLESHLQNEEQQLFPAFEQITGNSAGPTAVMRMEHEQMRAMVSDMNDALEQQNGETYLGLSETLMILMQQHNMKEEQILYPMTDRVIADSAGLIEGLTDL